MRFHKRACLERARARIADTSSEGLRYACLELRFCIESICYDKLRLYAKHIPPEVLNTWQPRKVVETLLEYDPQANASYTLNVWRNDESGTPQQLTFSGQHSVLSPTVLNRHYNKLGSYLHVPTPAQEQRGIIAPEELAEYLRSLVQELEGAASNTFDTNLAEVVTFDCDKCGQAIIRNAESLENNPIVVCTNQNCRAQYVMREENGAYTRQLRQVDFDCDQCGTKNYVEAQLLRENVNLTVRCVECGTQYVIGKEWVVGRKGEDA
jgi:predicted RNA-binding Zn-ribbon protein involved in translation (DUF1610 family)